MTSSGTVPVARPQVGVQLRHPAQGRQQQRDRVLGRGDRVAAGRVADPHPVLLRRCQVDVDRTRRHTTTSRSDPAAANTRPVNGATWVAEPP